jgi:hypothetical protein
MRQPLAIITTATALTRMRQLHGERMDALRCCRYGGTLRCGANAGGRGKWPPAHGRSGARMQDVVDNLDHAI